MKHACGLIAVLLLSLPGFSSSQTLRDLIAEYHYSYIPSDQGRFQTLVAFPGCSGISSDNPAAEESNARLREDDLLFRRHYRLMAEKLSELVGEHWQEGN